MKVVKISKEELYKIIKEEAVKIKNELNEADKAIEKVGDPVEDVKMNKNDALGDSKKALVYKDASKKEEKAGKAGNEVVDAKMNANDKKAGSDEKASAAVEVKAGSEKGGNGVTAGQHNAKFDSKKDNPSKESSDPFKEKGEKEMNTMDKENDQGTMTYVEAGAENGGNSVTAGQHKAVVKEKAPVVKDKEPIAKGIEIKESYTKDELQAFIISEAKKLAKKKNIEEELNKLKDELSSL